MVLLVFFFFLGFSSLSAALSITVCDKKRVTSISLFLPLHIVPVSILKIYVLELDKDVPIYSFRQSAFIRHLIYIWYCEKCERNEHYRLSIREPTLSL